MGLIVCIGAGPAGLTAAYELVKHKRQVLVLEADPAYVGGIARTIREKGEFGELCFDIGGHRFFSKSQEVVDLWKEILDNQLLKRPRKSRIFYDGKFYPYPLSLWPTFTNLGPVESLRCVLSYCYARLFPTPHPQTVEQWVTNKFGTRLYMTFFKTYTEKVWGMSCRDISADWAAQRIKGLSLFSAVRNAATRMMGLHGKNGKIKTLIEEFLYPRQGPGMMWEMAAKKITAGGGEVRLGQKVEKLAYDAAAKEWSITMRSAAGGIATVKAEQVISTMPLRELVNAIEGAPEAVRNAAALLRYRDFIIISLVLKDRKLFDDNWIYIHSPEVKVGRIQNFKAWSPEMVSNPDLVCYGMEYFCFEGDGLWIRTDDSLITLASEELVRIGLAEKKDLLGGYVVRQKKAYPVYDQAYESYVAIISKWLDESCPNLQIVGRNGMHKYNNQDHSMMTAMLAVKNILAGRREYDVWNVNQDAEYLESVKSGSQNGAAGERLVPRAK